MLQWLYFIPQLVYAIDKSKGINKSSETEKTKQTTMSIG